MRRHVSAVDVMEFGHNQNMVAAKKRFWTVTPRAKDCLGFVAAHHDNHGVMPSMKQLVDDMQSHPAVIRRYLEQLADFGLLKKLGHPIPYALPERKKP